MEDGRKMENSRNAWKRVVSADAEMRTIGQQACSAEEREISRSKIEAKELAEVRKRVNKQKTN